MQEDAYHYPTSAMEACLHRYVIRYHVGDAELLEVHPLLICTLPHNITIEG